MAKLTVRNVPVMSLGLLILCGTPALGQTIISGGYAHVNAATSGARAPGRMVNAGVVRALSAINLARRGVTITETERPMSFAATFLAEALPAIFEELNQAIIFFENLLRARAGLPLRVPDTTPPPPPDDGRDTSRKRR